MLFLPAAARASRIHVRPPERTIRAGGVRRKLLVLLAILSGGVALLPYVVAKSPLRNLLLAKGVPGEAVRISATDATLSWISGPALSGVAVVDPVGGPLLAAEQISLDRSPLDLLVNARNLGLITLTRPTIYLKLRSDGSNLEDAIDERAPGHAMEHLRHLGLHASAFAGGQNDDVEVGHVRWRAGVRARVGHESSAERPTAPRRASRSGSTRASARFSGLASIACAR